MFLALSRSDLGESLLITTLLRIPLGEPDGKTSTVRTLKRDLTACKKDNTEMQEAREDATERKFRLERQARDGMIRKPPYFPLE